MTRDPGLQPERTRLAWRRTVLAMAVVAVLAARLAIGAGPVGALVAAVSLAGWVALLLGTLSRTADPRRPPPTTPLLPVVALATVGYALLGIVLVFVSVG